MKSGQDNLKMYIFWFDISYINHVHVEGSDVQHVETIEWTTQKPVVPPPNTNTPERERKLIFQDPIFATEKTSLDVSEFFIMRKSSCFLITFLKLVEIYFSFTSFLNRIFSILNRNYSVSLLFTDQQLVNGLFNSNYSTSCV